MTAYLVPQCLAYADLAGAPPVTGLPALRNGFITFGSFNALSKISDLTIQMWADVLAAIDAMPIATKSAGSVEVAIQDSMVGTDSRASSRSNSQERLA